MALPQLYPVVQIDTREQLPLRIEAYPTEIVGLPVGDYGIRGFSDRTNPSFIVERKGLNDLVGSLTFGRERFMREIEKLRQFGFRALLVEGMREQVELGQYVSTATPQSILASIDALIVRAGVHVFWCGDPDGAARQLEALVRQFARGVEKNFRRLMPPRGTGSGDSCPVTAISGGEATTDTTEGGAA